MINWMQKTFHTDKKSGKVIFITTVYVLYWLLFYGSFSLIPENYFISSGNFITLFLFFYVFILIPSVSFILANLIKKNFFIKNIYWINIIFIILSLVIFFYIDFLKSIPNWFSF